MFCRNHFFEFGGNICEIKTRLMQTEHQALCFQTWLKGLVISWIQTAPWFLICFSPLCLSDCLLAGVIKSHPWNIMGKTALIPTYMGGHRQVPCVKHTSLFSYTPCPKRFMHMFPVMYLYMYRFSSICFPSSTLLSLRQAEDSFCYESNEWLNFKSSPGWGKQHFSWWGIQAPRESSLGRNENMAKGLILPILSSLWITLPRLIH